MVRPLILNGTLRERWLQYEDYVRLTLPVIEKEIPFTPALFACESALISGEDPARIPWPEWRTKHLDKAASQDEKWDEPTWSADFMINDVTVADSCITSRGRRHDIMHPMIVNMSLCRNRMEPKWRKTTYLGSSTGFPAAKHAERLVRYWRMAVLRGAERLVGTSDESRQIFAWATHDAFISFQPFKDGNERTARMMLQLVRRELELKPVFISRHDMTFHRERIRLFRTGFFAPLMEYYGFMG